MAATGDYHVTSQIPGLSNLAPEDSRQKQYIKESDSDYTKLAKQGGAKDLLAPEPAANDAPVQYRKSEWFGHHGMEDREQQKILAERKWKAPDYMTHESTNQGRNNNATAPETTACPANNARDERIAIQAKYNNRSVPFQSDDLSCWERKDEAPLRSRRHK